MSLSGGRLLWLGVCSWLVGWIGVGLACARGVADSGAALAHSRDVVFHEGCGVGFPASYECVYVMGRCCAAEIGCTQVTVAEHCAVYALPAALNKTDSVCQSESSFWR